MLAQLITLAVALITLAYGSYTDIKRRTINSFLFIPLIALSTAFYIYSGVSPLFVILGLLLFLFTFLKPDIVLYPLIGIALLASSFVLIFTSGIFIGFNLTIMAVIFLIGFQERFFGIGDIKALVAISYSFVSLPILTPVTAKQAIILSVMPPSLGILINVAIFSVLFLPYALLMMKRNGNGKNAPPFMMHYDEDFLSRNKAKFVVKELGGNKYLAYRTPFLLPITGGFLATIAFGIWFMLI